MARAGASTSLSGSVLPVVSDARRVDALAVAPAYELVKPLVSHSATPSAPQSEQERLDGDTIPPFSEFSPHIAYLKPEELQRVAEAYAFSIEAHHGQKRQSGEPYVTHPIAVATLVAEWQLDAQAIMAALLHDVLEDTGATKEQLTERFGSSVAELVDGLSKLDKIEFRSAAEAQAENFRKMLLAMSRDLRVILIKLADRLHNMMTLGSMRAEKRRRIARETLEIYAPIAHRLGLNMLCRELEEHCFAQVNPWRHAVLVKAVKAARGNRAELLAKVFDAIRHCVKASKITADVQGREKTIYSIYNKMREKHLTFSQVLDIFGVRLVVPDRPSCYLALGALHGLYKPIPGKFKDYIALPKANGYQSLHTALIGPHGMPLEIQVRSVEMHHVAQDGVASHWLYKSSDEAKNDMAAQTHLWLQSLLELQNGSGDSNEFLEHVKVDLFPDEVYVFTPKGRILALPRGATCVDFAYAVHTAVGDCCVAAKINHALVPLRSELNNGDRIEVVTAAHPNPNPAWLSFVKTARARSRIRHFLKNRQHDEAVRLGERFLDQALRPLGGSISQIGDATWDKLVHEATARTRTELLADLGLGRRNAALDARRLMLLGQFDLVEAGEPVALAVTGEESAAIQLAACCRPILGDAIVGVLSQGSGIVIHTQGCSLTKNLRTGSGLIEVEWDVAGDRMFDVNILVEVRNARGVLAHVASAIAHSASNIHNVHMDEKRADSVTTLKFTIEVGSRKHLAQVMRNVRKVSEVLRVSRERGARK